MLVTVGATLFGFSADGRWSGWPRGEERFLDVILDIKVEVNYILILLFQEFVM